MGGHECGLPGFSRGGYKDHVRVKYSNGIRGPIYSGGSELSLQAFTLD